MAYTEWYVDGDTGDDGTGDGSSGSPYATLQALLDNVTAGAAGNRVFIRDTATYSPSGGIDFSTFGEPTNSNPFALVGVDSGDNVLGIGSYVEMDFGSDGMFNNGASDNIHLMNLEVTHDDTSDLIFLDNSIRIYNCYLEKFGTGGNVVDIDNNCEIINSVIIGSANSSQDVINPANACFINGNVIISKGATGDAVYVNGGCVAVGNIIVCESDCYGIGMSGNTHGFAANNTILSTVASTKAGIELRQGHAAHRNYVEGFSIGIETNDTQARLVDNVLYNNTTNISIDSDGTPYGDVRNDTSASGTQLAKSGSYTTLALAKTYFEPASSSNLLATHVSDGLPDYVGAVQPPASGGGGGDTYNIAVNNVVQFGRGRSVSY